MTSTNGIPLVRFPSLSWYPQPQVQAKTGKGPYEPSKALEDLPGITYALHLFLASHMHESEEFCHQNDPPKERLYFATGFGLIQCVKALMSFDDQDLLEAIGHVKHGNAIASAHRKPAASLPTRLASYLIGSSNTGVGFIKSMTDVERHAELVYAESLYEKAIVGIAYSGDWLAFIKEALNMRTAFNIYRQLHQFIELADSEYRALHPPPSSSSSSSSSSTSQDSNSQAEIEDPSIDQHFRSGVYLGVGSANLILSMMPGRLLSLIELFGYKGDRKVGLQLLYRAGGWRKGSSEGPGVSKENEGIRRPICDMTLLIFHLVLSGFTFEGVDIGMAQKILEYHSERYPNGVFFLFGQGRLHICRSQPSLAIEYYKKAMQVQNQYRNLHHISFWEMAIANISLWEISASLECWRTLQAEATVSVFILNMHFILWSKATYTYGMAVCLLQSGLPKAREEAAKLMGKVAGLRQRIAGKSIPLEKFVARKARKFQDQSSHLILPALEFGYFFNCISHAPRDVIMHRILPLVEQALAYSKTFESKPGSYRYEKSVGGGKGGYWDDYCLGKFLEGICLRYIAYPDPDAVYDAEEKLPVSQPEAQTRALAAFDAVFAHGAKIQLDHFIVYYTHFELGRLLACAGDKEGARMHLELVLSGKPLEVNAAARKGKYSMENALHVRAHAALEALDRGGRL